MIKLTIQNVSSVKKTPSKKLFQTWIETALKNKSKQIDLCIRIVDENEIQQLNNQYRDKNKPTNILTFTYESNEKMIHGDLIVCAPIIKKEALEQEKTEEAHWAHMIIHSCLHLLGYDHQIDKEAEVMEGLEASLLKSFGY